MPRTKKQNWTIAGIATFFVTIIIPFVTWASGLMPEFASKDELKQLNNSQLQLRQEYLTDKVLQKKREQRELQQKMYELEQQSQQVPGFYHEEYESNAQDLDILERRIDDAQLQMEQLQSEE